MLTMFRMVMMMILTMLKMIMMMGKVTSRMSISETSKTMLMSLKSKYFHYEENDGSVDVDDV